MCDIREQMFKVLVDALFRESEGENIDMLRAGLGALMVLNAMADDEEEEETAQVSPQEFFDAYCRGIAHGAHKAGASPKEALRRAGLDDPFSWVETDGFEGHRFQGFPRSMVIKLVEVQGMIEGYREVKVSNLLKAEAEKMPNLTKSPKDFQPNADEYYVGRMRFRT